MAVAKSAVNAYLDRKLDSFLWMKKLSRLDIQRELREFKVRPKFKTEPWLHQLVCFYIGLYIPRFLYLLDMGLGKSWILMNIITQLRRERRLDKALILVPRLINLGSWADDLERHSDLEYRLVDIEDIEEKWYRLQKPGGDVTVIDYQSFQWAVCRKVKAKKGTKGYLEPDPKRIKHVQQMYNFTGIDESHTLSNPDNLWFDIVRQVTDRSDFVYAMTGTLFGSDPAEIWPQFALVDKGETFDGLGLFRSAFFTAEQHPFKGQVWTYNARRAKDMHRMLQHRSIRYDEQEIDEIDLPDRVMRPLAMLMTEEQTQHYMTALQGFINALNGFDTDQVKVTWHMLRRITSGYMKWSDDHGDHLIHFARNPKLEAMEQLLSDIGDKKMVIAYEYTETGQIIVNKLKQLGIKHEWLYGGSKDRASVRENFMYDRDTRVLVMNSTAGGTGTDGLQKVAHYLYFFESPRNPKKRKQTEKRIHRPGQNQRSFIYDAVMKHTVDQGILDAVNAGIDLYDSIVNGEKNAKASIFDAAKNL